MNRRREFSEPAPGVAKVRLSGDTVAADVLAAILRAHPAVEILTGPDRYDDGRQYLTVRVRMDGGLGRDALLDVLHPGRDRGEPAEAQARLDQLMKAGTPARDVTQCLASQCPPPRLDDCQWPRCAAQPALLRAPCDRFEAAGTTGLCATCGRSLHAHRVAAAAAGAPWTDDENDGGTP